MRISRVTQYAFHMKFPTWTELAAVNFLTDRVGMYQANEWVGSSRGPHHRGHRGRGDRQRGAGRARAPPQGQPAQRADDPAGRTGRSAADPLVPAGGDRGQRPGRAHPVPGAVRLGPGHAGDRRAGPRRAPPGGRGPARRLRRRARPASARRHGAVQPARRDGAGATRSWAPSTAWPASSAGRRTCPTEWPAPRSWSRSSRRTCKKVSAVGLEAEKENRRLHAKWIEWKIGQGTLSFTGSVNATHQSLCSTKNIEVGVLRFDASGKGWATWHKAAIPPSYETPAYRQAGMGESCLVFAELRDSGELKGRLLTLASTKGTWSGKIEKVSGESLEFAVTVDGEGQFSHYLTNADDFLYANALQIRLKAGDREARGWIQNAAVLNLPKIHRLPLSSLLRLINRDETEDDDIALLEYFAIHASEHFRTFRSRVSVINAPEHELADDQGSFSIDLEYLKPSREFRPVSGLDEVPRTSTEQALDHIFAQVRKRLLGQLLPRRKSGLIQAETGSDDVAEEQVADEDSPSIDEKEKLADALESFTDKMQSLVRTPDLSTEHRRAILVLWLEVMLHMLVRRRRDRAGAGAFLRAWFHLTISLCTLEDQADGLEQHLVTAAAILAALDSGESFGSATVIHEALEHYWKGPVDAERARIELLPYSSVGLTGLFFEQENLNLDHFLAMVLDTQTLGHELSKILELYKNGSSLPDDSQIFRTDAGKALLEEFKQQNHAPRYLVLKGASMVCPRDYIMPSEICRSDLEKHRVARCSSCGWLLLRVDP